MRISLIPIICFVKSPRVLELLALFETCIENPSSVRYSNEMHVFVHDVCEKDILFFILRSQEQSLN